MMIVCFKYMQMLNGKGLYVISIPSGVDAELLDAALGSGFVQMFQLRLKDVSQQFFYEQGMLCKTLCLKHGVPFVINDSYNLFTELDADGLHIGSDDGGGDIASVRAMVDKIANKNAGRAKILGISCYNLLNFAIECSLAGVSYVSFGAFFNTQTKDAKTRATPQIISDYNNYFVKNPLAPRAMLCGIGGIDASNAGYLVSLGLNYPSVISAAWQGGDVPSILQNLTNLHNAIIGGFGSKVQC